MKIKDLKNILSKIDDELEICISIGNGFELIKSITLADVYIDTEYSYQNKDRVLFDSIEYYSEKFIDDFNVRKI